VPARVTDPRTASGSQSWPSCHSCQSMRVCYHTSILGVICRVPAC
jgi:hypothetical protein